MEIGDRIYMSKNFRLIDDTEDSHFDKTGFGKTINIWLKEKSGLKANIMLESGEVLIGISINDFKKNYPNDYVEHFFSFYYVLTPKEFNLNEKCWEKVF